MSALFSAPAVAPDFDYATTSDLCERAAGQAAERWLWHGYLAAANVSLLVGQWKAGKTTLLSVFLARLLTGGTLAGQPVRAGRAVVITEEGKDLWIERGGRLGYESHLHVVSRPFRGRPTAEQWQRLIDSLVARHQKYPFELVVVDTLASFLTSRTENNAGIMLDMLLPLQAVTALGAGLLILHHPRRAPSAPGQLARGTGALCGAVDILLELEPVSGLGDEDRRRRLSGFSRYRETPRRVVIELTADGSDYVLLGDDIGHEFADQWQVLRGVLEDATGKLTRAEIVKQWPADFVKPSAMVVWRCLDRGVKEGLVLREGTGRRNHPFKYWLDGMEEVWRSAPGSVLDLAPLEPLEALGYGRQKTLAEVLAERQKKQMK